MLRRINRRHNFWWIFFPKAPKIFLKNGGRRSNDIQEVAFGSLFRFDLSFSLGECDLLGAGLNVRFGFEDKRGEMAEGWMPSRLFCGGIRLSGLWFTRYRGGEMGTTFEGRFLKDSAFYFFRQGKEPGRLEEGWLIIRHARGGKHPGGDKSK